MVVFTVVFAQKINVCGQLFSKLLIKFIVFSFINFGKVESRLYLANFQ